MDAKGVSILIVDDSSSNRAILAEMLSEYDCELASNGEEALELASKDPKPDLILLDVVMPGMSGYQVCRQLKADHETRHVPVIFLSSKSDSQSIVKGFDAGAIDYVTKPFNMSELKMRVNTHLSLKKSRDRNVSLIRDVREMNKKLTDSIAYAQKIQKAILPGDEYLSEILPEHFVFLQPRDVVSGDFYWIRKVQSRLVVIVADCTGHGVPGAFMSMMGMANLNEIVGKDSVTHPAKILNQLRHSIVDALKQDEQSEVKDGMDVAVLTFDQALRNVLYAGARTPLLHISGGVCKFYRADKMTISYRLTHQSFSSTHIELKPGDCLYLLTDGYSDQFGGEHDKKIMKKRIQEYLLSVYHLPMPEQGALLKRYFEKWKGTNEQVDDVLVIGLRV
jgi:CheY-like chemotaxis protein